MPVDHVEPPDRLPASPGTDHRPQWLTHDRWPFPIEHLRRNGRTIAYTDVGDGPVLVLIHVGFWGYLWRDLITNLQRDFRCVTLDAPGTGLSSGAPTVTFDDAADAIDTVVTHLDLDEITLVIHDLGGPAALHAASAWPERVEGLVAVNSFGWRPSGPAFRSMLRIMGSAIVRESDVLTGWLPRASSSRFGVGRRFDRADRRTFRRGVPPSGRRAFHHYMRSARQHDYTAVDGAVDHLRHRPLLTIFGARNDPLRFQRRWADGFARTTPTTVANGYHFPMCDAPDLVADAIRTWHQSHITH